MNYKTPGVYIKEESTLPPSVAAVGTAIPAFIGYTEMRVDENGHQEGEGVVIRRITGMLEYSTYFGGPKSMNFELKSDEDGVANFQLSDNGDNTYLMYYALRMYFNNGGGPCYIVSIGKHDEDKSTQDFENGLNMLKKEDEPTLIVLVDAINLSDQEQYYALCDKALAQCEELKDRFAVFDVPEDDNKAALVNEFREGVKGNLSYGAAYTPMLKTSLNYINQEADLSHVILGNYFWQEKTSDNGLGVQYAGKAESVTVEIKSEDKDPHFLIQDGPKLQIFGIEELKKPIQVLQAWNEWTGDKEGFDLHLAGTGKGNMAEEEFSLTNDTSLDSIKKFNTQLYNRYKRQLEKQAYVTLPPSFAMAGIYASVDRDRGVWKAPANVGLSSVIKPVHKITHEEQERLNVDPTSGKSINAIRAFTGRGVLVWGARTLAGNDNEWRYINVRRLFIFMEESLKKATNFAVFEPNDTTTWLKVKAMADSFLYGLWQQGALAGPTPEQAYYVNVGLGKTMTQQDVLEGRMIVEIGVAAVRPAEFIILKFSHKLQEA